MTLSALSGSELSSVASVLSEPAEKFGNDPQMEMLWAIKAYEHAEVYFNLLKSVDPTLLRLCSNNKELYTAFRESFPNVEINQINVDEMKSAEGKEQWRIFCNKFEGQVADWNMATLLRIDSKKDISEENTVIVPRVQFLAIEIARNIEGYNSDIRRLYGSHLNGQNGDKNDDGQNDNKNEDVKST